MGGKGWGNVSESISKSKPWMDGWGKGGGDWVGRDRGWVDGMGWGEGGRVCLSNVRVRLCE
jgi:hypothetical protein